VSAVYASQPISAEGLRSVETTCARVYQGNVAAQATCSNDYECVKDLICDKSHCGPRKMVGAGEGCANVGEVCPAGQVCKASAGGFAFCQKRQEKGMSCSAAEPCVESLRCSGGTCIDRLPPASVCTQHDDCAMIAPICDPYAGRCVSTLNFAVDSLSCRAFMSGGAAPDAAAPADVGGPAAADMSAAGVDSAGPSDGAATD
jgi:hypothetical protein